jgi:GNAT superfamily N-acetyltransferase
VGQVTAQNNQPMKNGGMSNAPLAAEDLPPAYPKSYECLVRLADGREVAIRPILPSDASELAEAIRTADAVTLRSRFLGGPPRLTPAVLEGLTRLDYVSRFALVAFSEGRGVGIARYAALPPSGEGDQGDGGMTVAEVAVAVAPQWRQVGLATALVERLARRAQECGITDFTAMFLAENRPVTELAHDGHARVVIAEGVAELHTKLGPLLGSPGDAPTEQR